MPDQASPIKEYESPARAMVSNAHKLPYRAIETLEEAKNIEDSYLVMQGDEGGQIYLTCPVRLITCDHAALDRLLVSIDKLSWDDISMAGLYFEVHKIGDLIIGGMGGGLAEDGLWVHERLNNQKEKINLVLSSAIESI